MTLAAWKAVLERQAQVRCNHPWHSPSQKMDSWPCLLSLLFLSHIRHWYNYVEVVLTLWLEILKDCCLLVLRFAMGFFKELIGQLSS